MPRSSATVGQPCRFAGQRQRGRHGLPRMQQVRSVAVRLGGGREGSGTVRAGNRQGGVAEAELH